MTLHARSPAEDQERQFVERLRARYEQEGFTFTAHPDRTKVPDFLGSYLPDALATMPGRNIVIEVKNRQGPSTELTLKNIRRLIEGQPGWQFHVAFMSADPMESVTLSRALPTAIQDRLQLVRAMSEQKQWGPAFVMAWSLLESVLLARDDNDAQHPRSPQAVVQALAMNGLIEPDTERTLRALIDLRNRVVHGDLSADPTAKNVEQVLQAIEEALSAEFA